MAVCDGCGATVDDAHIRARIERLEMATRYRPIRIQVLILDATPFARPEDFFYRASADHSERSAESRAYFDALIQCTEEGPSRFSREADALAEFQKQGLFLANVVECPVAANLDEALGRCGRSVLTRIQFSYKPKHVALISPALVSILGSLSLSDWAERLILNAGAPFDICSSSGGSGASQLAHGVRDRLAKAASNSTS
jgi:hypothetical protein